jgi:hypothetical protein
LSQVIQDVFRQAALVLRYGSKTGRFLSFFVLLAIGLVSRAGWAQVTVKGQVSDPTGAVLPGILLRLTAANGTYTQQTTSDETGQFRILGVPPGRYTLSSEVSNGFAASSATVEIRRSAPPPILVVLALASVTQETKVDASEQTLSTDPADNHDRVAVSADMLQQIPVLDQNYIAALSPFSINSESQPAE